MCWVRERKQGVCRNLLVLTFTHRCSVEFRYYDVWHGFRQINSSLSEEVYCLYIQESGCLSVMSFLWPALSRHSTSWFFSVFNF